MKFRKIIIKSFEGVVKPQPMTEEIFWLHYFPLYLYDIANRNHIFPCV